MRWKKRRKLNPDIGEKRVVKRFLWWPTCLNDEWRWLERAEIIQQFKRNERWVLGIGWDWMDVEWIDHHRDCDERRRK